MDKRWIKVLGLALSLPSTILLLSWFLYQAVQNRWLSAFWAVAIFLIVIGKMLFFMVWNARSPKDRS